MKTSSNQSLAETPKRSSRDEHNFGVPRSNSEIEETFTERFRLALSGSSVAAFARRAEVADSTLRSYLDGGSLPSWDTAVRIARAAGRSLDWFATPLPRGLAANEPMATYEVSDFVLLPLYDIRASAGHGAWNDDERVSKTLAFRRDWIAADLRANPDTLVLVYVDGDSMETTLSSGDVVMVDRSQLALRSDGIYVFSYDGSLLIKRLQRMAGDTVRVISDNPRFTAYDLQVQDFEGEHARAQMIGRVVWSGIRH